MLLSYQTSRDVQLSDPEMQLQANRYKVISRPCARHCPGVPSNVDESFGSEESIILRQSARLGIWLTDTATGMPSRR